MLAGLYAKLIVFAVLLALLAGAGFYLHHRGAVSGAARVQAQWDAAKATQAMVAITASEAARKTETAQANAFAGITTDYLQANTHAYPSLADAIPAALSAGTVRLRGTCPAAPASGGVSAAAAASLAADAARTQALADRQVAAVAVIRAGDAADARERKLGEQITALQALLLAERAGATK